MSGVGENLAAVFWFYLLLGASAVLTLVFVAGVVLALWSWSLSWLWLSAGGIDRLATGCVGLPVVVCVEIAGDV